MAEAGKAVCTYCKNTAVLGSKPPICGRCEDALKTKNDFEERLNTIREAVGWGASGKPVETAIDLLADLVEELYQRNP